MLHFLRSHQTFFFTGLLMLSFLLVVPTRASAQSPTGEPALLFTQESVNTKVGESFTTDVSIDTAGAQVGGVGAKIIFDPQALEVSQIETLPVFPDYPAANQDNIKGTILISGIVQDKSQLYSGKGTFAKIHWTAKSAGETKIQFNYVPNETKDSNIAVLYGTGDILQKVNTVAVTIVGEPTSSAAIIAPTDSQNPPVSNSTNPPSQANSDSDFFTPQKVLAVLLLASFVLHFILFKKVLALEQALNASKQKPVSTTPATTTI